MTHDDRLGLILFSALALFLAPLAISWLAEFIATEKTVNATRPFIATVFVLLSSAGTLGGVAVIASRLVDESHVAFAGLSLIDLAIPLSGLFLIASVWLTALQVFHIRDFILQPRLRWLLDDVNPATRQQAARTLGQFGSSRCLPDLARLLHDHDIEVRSAAFDSLLELSRNMRNVILDDLVGLSLFEPDPDLRARAVKELAHAARYTLRVAQESVGGDIAGAHAKNAAQKGLLTLVIPALTKLLPDVDDDSRHDLLAAVEVIAGPQVAALLQHASPRDTSSKRLLVSAFYPHEVSIGGDYVVVVYLHLSSDSRARTNTIATKGSPLEGTAVEEHASPLSNVQPGTVITFVVDASGLTLTPSSQAADWDGNWAHALFEMSVLADPKTPSPSVCILVFANSIEIAQLRLSPRVVSKEPGDVAAAAANNVKTAVAHQRVFVSYAHEDSEIVEVCRLAQLALGNEVFVDRYSIRAGEDWRVALETAIDAADVFQLFWSKRSSTSTPVREEWMYALTFRCPETKCRDFIRPVFWTEPIPAPPAELSHLHFKYVPLRPLRRASGLIETQLTRHATTGGGGYESTP